ncbi:helix-turn-helix domain-containing protein [Ichthyenterobacterium magnum]|uniref:Helix-turn-helix protein n=1 Tax=Ichthyenterobacterium magnum TaxID=1230530 RepID=A0A420DGX3_9FLAO|nr:helix-turn-helix transcriptional regulator [Ichthyenterobacterium magnum]RKE92335.1 helix-turn-helix protein [Ichthyenterobacterium magnum]
MKKNNIISNWLKENGNIETEMLVKRNLAIANKVRNILNDRNLNDGDFAELLEKTRSEVSKWLSGSHNLTQKSIIKMEIALGVKLIYIEQVHKYVYLGKIEGSLKEEAKKYSEGDYKKTMPAYAS